MNTNSKMKIDNHKLIDNNLSRKRTNGTNSNTFSVKMNCKKCVLSVVCKCVSAYIQRKNVDAIDFIYVLGNLTQCILCLKLVCNKHCVKKNWNFYLPLLKLRYFMNSPRTSSKLFLFFLLFVYCHTRTHAQCTHMPTHTDAHTNEKKCKKKNQNIKCQNVQV